jgi:hypothetical protein
MLRPTHAQGLKQRRDTVKNEALTAIVANIVFIIEVFFAFDHLDGILSKRPHSDEKDRL